MFTCLLSHIEAADYSTGCRDQLAAQQARRVKDWRLDYDLRQACKEDVPKVRPCLILYRIPGMSFINPLPPIMTLHARVSAVKQRPAMRLYESGRDAHTSWQSPLIPICSGSNLGCPILKS